MNEKFQFKKKFGQNFLKNEKVLAKIVEAADIKDESLIIEVGPGEKVDGVLQEMYVKKGDNVYVSKYAGTEVKYQGEDYIIVKQEDILAIVD